MLLTTPSKVLGLAGITPSSGALTHATLAIAQTLPVIEGLLETALVRQTWRDYFNYHGRPYRDDRRTLPALRLAHRYLVGSVVLRESEEGAPLVGAAGQVVASDEYLLNTEQGILTLLQPRPHGYATLSVLYTAGFTVGEDDVLQNIPDWLEKAGIIGALYILNSQPSQPANRRQATVATVMRELRRQLYTALAPNFRQRPVLIEAPAGTEAITDG